MSELYQVLGVAVLVLCCVVALASLVFGLPGTFLIVGVAFVYAWVTDFAGVTLVTVFGLLGLALIAEGIEFLSAAAGSKDPSLAPSRRITVLAILGAVVGAIAGAPLLFGLGALLGAFGGAFAGAALAAASLGHDRSAVFRHGMHALRGRVLGFVVKSALATVMSVWLVVSAL
jgi:hypothetical protein